ncbi:MAG: acyl-CoA thioesterase [Sphingobacteriales bacterium]|nr:acyl-CoA thioesterase [Sphingobacteriales bacterium]
MYKTASVSETIKTEVVCPNDTNPMGMLQGGRLVEWMDIAAAVCAQTHSGKICVTASINHVEFNAAAKVGDIITINAKITRAFTTSMEIFVHAFARSVLAARKYLISEAYFSFVALDEKGKATQVIAVEPVTAFEKEQYNAALRRKNKAFQLKKRTGKVII